MEPKPNSFREKPEFQRGHEGELRVADLLKRRGWCIVPSYDYSGKEGDMPPRLQGLKQAWPVPDLDISRNGERRWVEVKTKARADYTRTTQRYEHGIPLRHYRAYLDVERITGTPVWLFVVEESTGAILAARLSDLDSVKRVYDGPKMSRGGMAYFPRDAFVVAREDSPPCTPPTTPKPSGGTSRTPSLTWPP
jgi:hypothetical protein